MIGNDPQSAGEALKAFLQPWHEAVRLVLLPIHPVKTPPLQREHWLGRG